MYEHSEEVTYMFYMILVPTIVSILLSISDIGSVKHLDKPAMNFRTHQIIEDWLGIKYSFGLYGLIEKNVLC